MLSLSSKEQSGRMQLTSVFGDDCARISRTHAVLDAIMSSGFASNFEDRVLQCQKACESVENVLQDIGLAVELRRSRESETQKLLEQTQFDPSMLSPRSFATSENAGEVLFSPRGFGRRASVKRGFLEPGDFRGASLGEASYPGDIEATAQSKPVVNDWWAVPEWWAHKSSKAPGHTDVLTVLDEKDARMCGCCFEAHVVLAKDSDYRAAKGSLATLASAAAVFVLLL